MTKKVVKVLTTVILTIALIGSITMSVNAGDGQQDKTISFGSIDTKTVTANATDTTGAATSLNRIIGSAMTVAQVIGVGIAVIMLIVLAIKYISAAPGDKADIKKHAVVYVVGAVVLFAASGILGIVKNFAANITANE